MHALDADHYPISSYNIVKDYDNIFIIFPKGRVYLSAEGSKLLNELNPVSELLNINIAEKLKLQNKKVWYVQEGPHWWFNDYELADQINFYNMLNSCDGIFAHNEIDKKYYNGLIHNKPCNIIPSLMIEHKIKDIIPIPEDKVIIGGNLCRWYGGFESFIVAQELGIPIWGQTSHAIRTGEDQIINHLTRLFWTSWMEELSTFKYAVHLMPTVAAGTFSLNCAYFGIPCIGNIEVDTQRNCYPFTSVDINDISKARTLVSRLQNDPEFYKLCSDTAKKNYAEQYKDSLFKWKIFNILK
jgi:hypothetical protein